MNHPRFIVVALIDDYSYKVVDTVTGTVCKITSDSNLAHDLADSLNLTASSPRQDFQATAALALRKMLLVPLTLSLIYFLLGLFMHATQGYPQGSWLLISSFGLLGLLVLWGSLSFVFTIAAGKPYKESDNDRT